MIRRAGMADVDWLLQAGDLAQRESIWYRDLPAAPAEQYKAIVRILQYPELLYIGVVDDRSGFIFGALEPSIWFAAKYAVQSILWVAPEKRGTWRAWRLVAAFEAWAREAGASRVLNGVSSGLAEDKVDRFYRKMGYSPMGMSYYKELS